MPKPLPKFQDGIVLLLDALGAKQYSEQEAIWYLALRDYIISDLQHEIQPYIEQIAQIEVTYTGTTPEPPQVITFGDTIAITWEPTRFLPDKDMFLLHVIIMAIDFISKGLSGPIPLRGAISLGKYLRFENTILGPAVADAAFWYEQPQMIGAIATPRTSIAFKWLFERSKSFSTFVTEYDVPIKNNKTLRTYTVNWPSGYMIPYFEGKTSTHYRESFYSDLKKMTIPPGTENKYQNTLDFFDYCDNKYSEVIRNTIRKSE